MKYSEEMSEKIMAASPSELKEISEEIEFTIYEKLSKPAKARLAPIFDSNVRSWEAVDLRQF